MFSLIKFSFKDITFIYVTLLLVSTNLFAKAFFSTPGRTRGFLKPKGNNKMEGRIQKLQYLYDGEFRDGGIDGRYVFFPVTALRFISMGKGRDTLLHGSVCLKMQCSVGDMHMPESTAVFTMFIH